MRRILLLGLAAATVSVHAETVYISDRLTVPLRSGPSNGHRILHRGLPSGTEMEVLGVDEEAGFTRIRTDRGTEGWIPTQYLVSEPIARAQLENATQRLARLEERLSEASGNIETLTSQRNEARRDSESLSRQVESLQTELAEIKRISAGAIAEHANNQTLTQLNDRLRNEIDDLLAQRKALESNVQQRWMLIGAGLVLGGLLLGVFVKSRPRRSGWS